MELLALEKADKLLRKENQSRRKLRQVQVREQSSEWMERNRQKYLEEKERQIQLITETLTLEAQNKAVKQIEEMEKMHDLCSAQVGAAHRAAAGLPDFETLKSQKNYENLEKAKDRGAQALANEKLAAETALKVSRHARILRENVRRDENYKFKEFVARSAYMTKSQAAVDRIVDKLTNKKTERIRRPEYQPSLAKTLRVPNLSHSEAKLNKTKRQTRLSRKPKDVAYYDSAVPQNSLKYPQPPGLVQKHTKENHPTNAFDAAQRITAHQEQLDSKKKLEDTKKAKIANKRGKSAIKVAKLQRQLDQITNEFEADGFLVDPKLNDSFLGLSDSENEDALKTHDVTDDVHPKSATTPQKSPKKRDKNQGFNAVEPPESIDKDSKRKTPPLPAAKPPVSPVSKQKTEPTGKLPTSPIAKQKQGKHGIDKQSQHAESPTAGTASPKSAMSDQTGPDRSLTRPVTSPAKKSELADRQPILPVSSAKPRQPPVSPISSPKPRQQPVSPISSPKPRQPPVSPISSTKPRQQVNGASQHSDVEKPKLLSSRRSVRQQTSFNSESRPESRLSEEINETSKSKKSQLDKKSGEMVDGKLASTAKSTPKSKLSVKDGENGSSSSMHTLSSPENPSDQPITDYFSPPDQSKSFPLTSTPAEDEDGQVQRPQGVQRPNKNSTADSSRNTTTGTLSPQTAAKRKRALHYYVTKLLQMRPESMCNLQASSLTSISSYVEIPTSAVTSIIGSDPPSANSSDYSIPAGLASWRTATPCQENGKFVISYPTDNTNNTTNISPSYNTGNGTTLSSVTEEDETEGENLKQFDTVDSGDYDSGRANQISSTSSETIAKVTFAVSPRSTKK